MRPCRWAHASINFFKGDVRLILKASSRRSCAQRNAELMLSTLTWLVSELGARLYLASHFDSYGVVGRGSGRVACRAAGGAATARLDGRAHPPLGPHILAVERSRRPAQAPPDPSIEWSVT